MSLILKFKVFQQTIANLKLFTNMNNFTTLGRHVSTLSDFELQNDKYNFKLNTEKQVLSMKSNNESMDFPFVWLRDNCQCDQCFHKASKSRILNWEHFDVNPKVNNIHLKNNETVNITWSDSHSSDYLIEWLQERSFLKSHRERYTNSMYHYKKIEWTNKYFDSILKKYDYQEILNNNNHLKDWLENLSIYGVAIITGVTPSTDSSRKLANRVEFIKKTHYGEEFIVKNKPDTTNVAYLSANLQFHTDLPYYEHSAGVIMLHYLTQSAGSGGENLLADGLSIANQLKENYRPHYDILTQTPIDWEDFAEENGNKFHSLYRSPVICEDLNGRIVRINCSTPQRGSHFDVPLEKVKPWYEAYRVFLNMAFEQAAKFKVSEGCILSFDNSRLVHGRTEYKDTQENVRYLIGVYLDWDYINSRIRILNTK